MAYLKPVRIVWDASKDATNRRKHRLSFEEASALFDAGVDYLEIFDEAHSAEEDRFIAIGPIPSGLIVVVFVEPEEETLRNHQRSPRDQEGTEGVPVLRGREAAMSIPELTEEQMKRAIPASVRRRLMLGKIESGSDVAALRKFVGLSQPQFASAMGISVHTLRNWEQGRRRPEGPALSLLRIAARHPRMIRENVAKAA